MNRNLANSERTVKFWRYYAVFSVLIAAAIALPAITTIPLEQDSLREVTRDAAVSTVEAAATTVGKAYAGGKISDLQQELLRVIRRQPTIVSGLVTGWTGKIIAASDSRQEGKLLIDLFPPPVSAVARTVRRDDGTESIEVTVPLKLNDQLRGALRAEVMPAPVQTERWTAIGKIATLAAALLGFLAFAGAMRLRSRERPAHPARIRVQPERREERREEKPIEERKEAPPLPADEILRAAMDLLPLALLVVDDVSGEVRFANQPFCRLWELGELGDRLWSGRMLYDQVATACRPLVEGSVPALPERRLTSLDPDTDPVEITCSEGRIVRRYSIPFSTDAGGKPARLYVFEDLTNSQRMIEQLKRGREDAEQSARREAEFLATMTNELRGPLNGLIGTLGLLAETPLTLQQGKYAGAVRESAETMLALVNGVHDLSSLDAGALRLTTADLDLRRLLHEVVTRFSDPAQRKGIELMCFADENLPRSAMGDGERLGQVLTILLDNAVRYTERGEIVVTAAAGTASAGLHIASDGSHTVRAQNRNRAGNLATVRFEVRDTGAGIPLEQQGRVFELISPTPLGRGRMSLTVAKRLIEYMGGDVGVESEVGQGSTFWFSLPLQVQSQSNSERVVPDDAVANARILIVDDNATARNLIEQQLRAWRITSESAGSAPEALKLLRNAAEFGTPYSLAIIDAQMPETDGVGLEQAIAAEPKLAHLPLLLLTSGGSYRAPQQPARIVATLQKPVRASPLFDSLMNLFERPSEIGTQLAPPPVPELPATPPPAPVEPAGRVLLAEDNLINQRIALRMLERLGYRTDVVVNGQQAVEAALRESYDAILMDCQMPEMDGLTATEIIREQEGTERHTPIIAITANAVDGDRERCIAAGMDDYLAKPVKVAELEITLGRWVRPNPNRNGANSVEGTSTPTRPGSGVAGAAA